jgi:cytochrome c oxidase assembly protein subunit 15
VNTPSWLNKLSLLSITLALGVILLGAFTRLSDAGLGCPDWPGCYGQFNAPSNMQEITRANQAYPAIPVDIHKAQTEMTHRYFAESLGLLIIIFAIGAYWKRKTLNLPLWLPGTLVLLVIGQGMLGMWTVTMKLLPLIVLSHLLGGFCTLSLLWLSGLYLRSKQTIATPISKNLSRFSLLTLVVLIVQIILGGWTSTNYAALICPDFPMCQGQWWPDFSMRAFHFFGATVSDPLGFMTAIEKTSIHVSHRLGALITFILGAILSYKLWQQTSPILKRLSLWLGLFLILQVSLGISNIVLHLPLGVAVAHNGIAALLLLTLITINFTLHHKVRTWQE